MLTTTVYDLRPLLPAQRHTLAFQAFDALGAGESFELLNDHEPRSLLLQFIEQRPDRFDWQATQAADGTWHIRIVCLGADARVRAPAAAEPGCCGCSCGGRG